MKITGRKNDTLKILKGKWDFRYVQVLLERRSKDFSYYATDLVIDSNWFVMNLSEAAITGTILRKNNKYVFQFSEEDCKTYWQEDTLGCKDMEIYSLEKDVLILLKRGTKAEYYFDKRKGIADVLFVYQRKRQQ